MESNKKVKKEEENGWNGDHPGAVEESRPYTIECKDNNLYLTSDEAETLCQSSCGYIRSAWNTEQSRFKESTTKTLFLHQFEQKPIFLLVLLLLNGNNKVVFEYFSNRESDNMDIVEDVNDTVDAINEVADYLQVIPFFPNHITNKQQNNMWREQKLMKQLIARYIQLNWNDQEVSKVHISSKSLSPQKVRKLSGVLSRHGMLLLPGVFGLQDPYLTLEDQVDESTTNNIEPTQSMTVVSKMILCAVFTHVVRLFAGSRWHLSEHSRLHISVRATKGTAARSRGQCPLEDRIGARIYYEDKENKTVEIVTWKGTTAQIAAAQQMLSNIVAFAIPSYMPKIGNIQNQSTPSKGLYPCCIKMICPTQLDLDSFANALASLGKQAPVLHWDISEGTFWVNSDPAMAAQIMVLVKAVKENNSCSTCLVFGNLQVEEHGDQ